MSSSEFFYPIVIKDVKRSVVGTLKLNDEQIDFLKKEYCMSYIREFLLCRDGAIRPV